MTERLYIRPGDEARGCDVHDWPTLGMARRLIEEMRRKHGAGGVNACVPCLERAKGDAAGRLERRLWPPKLDDAPKPRGGKCHGQPAEHFHEGRGQDGRPLWRCSGCGQVGQWTESWSYFGAYGCPREHEPCITYVVCSDACRPKTRANRKDGAP